MRVPQLCSISLWRCQQRSSSKPATAWPCSRAPVDRAAEAAAGQVVQAVGEAGQVALHIHGGQWEEGGVVDREIGDQWLSHHAFRQVPAGVVKYLAPGPRSEHPAIEPGCHACCQPARPSHPSMRPASQGWPSGQLASQRSPPAAACVRPAPRPRRAAGRARWQTRGPGSSTAAGPGRGGGGGRRAGG